MGLLGADDEADVDKLEKELNSLDAEGLQTIEDLVGQLEEFAGVN